MPPHENAGDEVDWPAAAVEVGLLFPEDYREFVAVYGSGAISGSITVAIPPPNAPESFTVDRLPHDTRTSPAMQNWQDPNLGGRYSLDKMLVWGQTAGADALCWLTSAASPEDWPVAVWARHGAGLDPWTGKIDSIAGMEFD
ncbi:SMI1/KNR4 family protein [Streptomyces sp. PR69]|uniref:SMI1/KNR4 family protein n=1 Tax=Streptomyces sp. PR69 TaxID=2984950 RepID=UPI003A5BA745